MKELIEKLWKIIWEDLSPQTKKRLLPLLCGLFVLAAAFVLVERYGSDMKTVRMVLNHPLFQWTACVVLAGLTGVYANSLVRQRLHRGRFVRIAIILCLSAAITFLFVRMQLAREQVVHLKICQFGSINYNDQVLKYLVQELNNNCRHFEFTVYDRAAIDADGVRDANYEYLFELLDAMDVRQERRASSERELWIGIASFPFDGGYFSLYKPHQVVITTADYPAFEPPTVYEYLIHEMLVASLYALTGSTTNPLQPHAYGETGGCVFDFAAQRLDIRNSIRNSRFCPAHAEIARKHLSADTVAELEGILSFDWMRKEKVRSDLKNLYNYQFL